MISTALAMPDELLCAVLEQAIEEDPAAGEDGTWAASVARRLDCTTMSAVGALRRLERRGLVRRLGIDDHRMTKWDLTDDGAALAAQWGEPLPSDTAAEAPYDPARGYEQLRRRVLACMGAQRCAHAA